MKTSLALLCLSLLAAETAAADAFRHGEDARVRHAWERYPYCNLKTAAGLPVGPFELPVDPE